MKLVGVVLRDHLRLKLALVSNNKICGGHGGPPPQGDDNG